ncbi:MAG: histidine kinase N-terminal 7TM domain-containing protein [Methanomassiliicoccales archaeon]
MSDIYPAILTIQIAGALSLIALIWYSLRFTARRETYWFQWLMVAALGWSICYGLELAVGGLEWKTAMLELRFLFVPFMGFMGFGLAMEICGRGAWLTRRRISLLLVIPLISTILALAMPYTGLVKVIGGMDTSGAFPMLIVTNGPWFYVMNFNNVGLILAGCFLIALKVRTSRRLYRNQAALLILAFVIPIIADFLFQMGITPVKGYNPVSTVFVFTNLMLAWSIYKYSMLKLKPFARQQVIDSMLDIMIVEDSTGHIADVNGAALAFKGMGEQQLIGAATTTVFPELRLEGEIRTGMLIAPLTMNHGAQVQHFDCHRIPLEEGERGGTLYLLHDVTSRVHAEELLRESDRVSRELMEAAPFPVVIVDLASGGANYFNKWAEEQFLVSMERLSEYAVSDFYVNVEDRARLYQDIKKNGAVVDMEVLMRRTDGHEFWALISARNIEYERRPCLFAAFKDITERRMAAQSLTRNNEKLKLMSSITRHDLTNNIMGMMGYIDLARRESDAGRRETQLRKARDMGTQAQGLLRFTRDYEEVGAEAPQWQVISDVIANAKGQLELGAVDLEIHTEGLMVCADVMLVKVFYNLMENSLRHGGDVTRISVISTRGPEGLIITYSDNGKGIREDEKTRIFERGFGSNTGMGLFLTRQVLSITNMTIKENGILGEGARFEILVPAGSYNIRS